MNILSYDKKKGAMEVVPKNPDDLWVLYNVIYKGDRVYAKTTREVKVDEESSRPTESKRVSIYLGIQVEKKLFQRRTDRLRINGPVIEAPEKFGIKGSYHTISVSADRPVTIVKDDWLTYDLERIERATKEETMPILIVSIDDDEACIAVLSQSDFEVKASISAKLPGKLEAEKRESATLGYFKEILQSLSSTWDEKHGLIAVVGPGFWKEIFVKYVKDKRLDVAKSIATVGAAGSGGVGGAREALRSGILSKVFKESRIIAETSVVEEVLARLGAQRGNVTYGLNDVKKAAEYGAVELLLIADELLREAEDEERNSLEDLMKSIEKMRGKVMIIDSEHEAGRKLLGLGGIAALLRFSVN